MLRSILKSQPVVMSFFVLLTVLLSLGLLQLTLYGAKTHTDENPSFLGEIYEEDQGVWEIFFSVFGLIYALVVGLFMVEAHRRIRELATAVQSELNAIADIDDFLKYFGDGESSLREVKDVRAALLSYAENEVVCDLDPSKRAMGLQTEDRRTEVTAVIRTVSRLVTRDENDRYALEAIMTKVGQMTTFRAQKSEVARRGFPLPFYALLVFMSLVIIVGVVLLKVESVDLHRVLVSVTAFATSGLFLLVWDLDRPLFGYWNIYDELKSDVREIVERLASR